jgi:hypothetical protein
MPPFIDARIPVVFVKEPAPGPSDAVLCEGVGPPTPAREWFRVVRGPHAPGCACCAPRNPAGQAIARLMLDRGRGTGPFFTRILVVTRSEDGRDAVLRALVDDPIAASFCRPA